MSEQNETPQPHPHPRTPAPAAGTPEEAASPALDLLLVGGRVIDPETGLDDLRNVGIRDGRIGYVGTGRPESRETLDVAGLVVAPGFIDLHSHALNLAGMRFQALDGVTTALELEGGAALPAETYRWMEEAGRPINFGFSAGWIHARMHVLDGVELLDPSGTPGFQAPKDMFADNQAGPRWRAPADSQELERILAVVREQVAGGAIGVGALLGYAPASAPEELLALGAIAAEAGQPLFVHSRFMSPSEPDSALDSAAELVRVAEASGARVHLCHLNSTSGQLIDEVSAALLDARDRGVRISTETYPYSAGSTAIGAMFLAPDQLPNNRLAPSSLIYLPTKERVADAARLEELRREDPGGSCIVEFLDESDPEDLALFLRAMTIPGAAIASDAAGMTYAGPESGRAGAEAAVAAGAWPVPEGYIAHPRSAGCFAKAIGWLARDLGVLPLAEVIARATIVPATILADAVPAMARKGRVQVGADADLAVFDYASVRANATYSELLPSTGFRHVFVGGVAVVADGGIRPDATPGRAIRGTGGRPAAARPAPASAPRAG